MRKIVCFTFAYLLSIGAGVAYNSPDGGCYHVRDISLLPSSMKHLTAGDIKSDIAPFDLIVYFEQDHPKTSETTFNQLPNLPANCEQELRQIFSNINLESGGKVLLLGTTNKDGNPGYNNRLSHRRVESVSGLFPSTIETYEMRGGEAQADVVEEDLGSYEPRWRAVNIIWKNQQISETKIIEQITKQNSSIGITLGAVQTVTIEKVNDAQLLSQRINSLAQQLDSFDFDKSHWKNKNGGFNTARLLSDSVAGIVLGTTGGIITSNIIKKNQLRSGFESIQCTIGGQIVSEYNDEFVVGIK